MTTPGLYRHYKGAYYRVLFVAKESTNDRQGRDVVVYISLTTGQVHTRDLEEFEGEALIEHEPSIIVGTPRVSYKVRRFYPVFTIEADRKSFIGPPDCECASCKGAYG